MGYTFIVAPGSTFLPKAIVAVIIIIATGLALAFGDTSGGFRRLIQIVFGLSIAWGRLSIILFTLAVFAGLLGREVPCNRASVTLAHGDEVLVGQYSGPRLPEGARR